MGRGSVTWPQVLAWRLARQGLDPVSGLDTVALAGRLGGVQAQVASAADLAVAVRQRKPRRSPVTTALADRTLIKTWAMRGTLHALPADTAGAYLRLLADLRSWEKGSWQKAFGATPAEMSLLAEAVGDALAGRMLSREELVAEVVDRTGSGHLRDALRSGWSMLLKPVAWQGLLCHGSRADDGRVTFTRPDTWAPGWRGLPMPDEAAVIAITAYLGAYGPATPDHFDNWLMRRTVPKARLRGWFEMLGERLSTVDVEGVPLRMLTEDVAELRATRPSRSVRLVPGFDQYLLGPGTDAEEIVPALRRKEVSRAAGWISPVVLSDGRVVGVWEVDDGTIRVRLWEEVPDKRIHAELERITPALRDAAVAPVPPANLIIVRVD